MEQKETAEHIVVVGAGLAGLAVALGLHRKGVRSLVLESSPALRASGYAITTWRNAFRALDALGVADKIRELHQHIHQVIKGEMAKSSAKSSATFQVSTFLPRTDHTNVVTLGCRGPHETRRVKRDLLLRALEEELPAGTIRYSSKIVSIQEDDVGGAAKIVHLADGSALRAKVLIGCDGINSVVAKWLGLAEPSCSGRLATRGLASYPDGHGFQPEFLQFIGQGFRFGFVPCDDTDIYWFYTWRPSQNDERVDASAGKMKQHVLTKLRRSKVPVEALEMVERSEMGDAPAAQLRFRSPLSLLFANISKGNVCVAGDALHPMTPDLGQGGCSALEDGVVLARCLSEAVLGEGRGTEEERIETGLRNYAGIRRWRSVELVGTAYAVGFIQQSDNAMVSLLREKILAGALARRILKMADYDCGTL